MESVVYSPVSALEANSFTENSLRALKYHELLKLSNQYNIKKRWAKKEELISALLAAVKTTHVNEEQCEWTDGRELFQQNPFCPANKENDVRSTFTISKPLDPRATYDLTALTKESLLSIVPDGQNKLTFNIPKSSTTVINNDSSIKRGGNAKIKMLTVPSASGRLEGKKRSQLATIKQSPLKLSSKSLGIKKTKTAFSPQKGFLPFHARAMAVEQTAKRTSTMKDQTRVSSKTVENRGLVQAVGDSRRSSLRRKSRSDDPEVRRRSTLQIPTTTALRTPPPSFQNTKPTLVSGIKPITTGKVPNFAAIHERQFKKMDSLDEYINKKSERVKQLFGTPTVYKAKPEPNSNFHQDKILPKKDSTIKKSDLTSKLDARKNMLSRSQQIRTQTDVKDKTRSHIHGIRVNRRFELQMKMRNLL